MAGRIHAAADVVAETRGRALIGVLAWVKQTYGRDAVSELRDAIQGPLAEVLAHPVESRRWYPYPIFAALLRAVDAEFGDGDLELCRDFGRWAGQKDLRGVLDGAVRSQSPQRLIIAARMVWPRYTRHAGRLETVRSDPDDTRIRIRDFDEMDQSHCRMMEGWLVGAMEALGCDVLHGSREVLCPHHGGPFHEFKGAWRPR